MSEQEQPAEGSDGKEKGMSGQFIGRLIVYGLLAVLVVVGLLDYRVKSAATATGAAWRDAKQEVDASENEDLLQSQLKQYIKGNPTRETRDARTMDGMLIDSIVTYSWAGVIRDYHIYVGIGLGADPPVEAFRGPGDKDPLAQDH